MSRSVITVAVLGSAGIIAAYAASGAPPSAKKTAPTAASASPVVLELYQSQGCSSCPPALAVLDKVAARPDVLALNFAVTYWDQLGWKDRFAKPEFTARQWEYARSGGRGNVQTPQLIVNGQAAILGSRPQEVDATIAAQRPAAGAPAITGTPGSVTVGAGRGKATVWAADYNPRRLDVPIRAGENGGRTLGHRNIVTRMTALGTWTGSPARFALPALGAGEARAILVQSGKGGPIVAARKL
ncbi:MAG: DUF1223 domain-containing protein [Sphingomonadaceae bacterium]